MSLNHTHVLYDNKVLEFKIENQLKSLLDLSQFCTVDTSLQGVAGDHITTWTYKTTEGKTQVLEMGSGNTDNIEVQLTSEDHKIQLYQNRFPYYDEEVMRDPKAIEVGLNAQTVDMYNKLNADVMAEFKKATLEAKANKFDFNCFVDAIALFPNVEYENGQPSLFALCHKDDVAEIRKELGEALKYVEAYVRTGYIGTVAGVNLYTSMIATKGTIVVATKKAVKLLIKQGTTTEKERTDANKRLTTVYARKYAIAYFADAKEAVKITKAL